MADLTRAPGMSQLSHEGEGPRVPRAPYPSLHPMVEGDTYYTCEAKSKKNTNICFYFMLSIYFSVTTKITIFCL